MSGTSKIASARAHQRAPEPHIEWGTVGAFVRSAWSLPILKAPTPSSSINTPTVEDEGVLDVVDPITLIAAALAVGASAGLGDAGVAGDQGCLRRVERVDQAAFGRRCEGRGDLG